MYETITLEREEGIGILTFNRPDMLNAMNFQFVEDLHGAFDELKRDLKTRVLILNGNGTAFCAGADLTIDTEKWPEDVGTLQKRYRMQQSFASLSIRLREIPQPVIAAVHGPVVGGGLAMCAACDIRIADETARFTGAMIKIGLSGGEMGASWFLPRILGASAAAEILYTGRFFDAKKALDLGFVSQMVEKGTHVDAAREIAREIMRNTPYGIRMTKELLNVSLDAPGLRHQIEIENRTQILCTYAEDFNESIEAFFEKRDPQYKDR
ncbi:enoyl-CoA hydratase/isomerase family protein [Thermodesulfobacteriota bacterium]